MPAFPKDSAIIIIRAATDGYFTEIYQWPESPPPVSFTPLLRDITPTTSFDDNRVELTKPELIAEFTNWVNNDFDQ